VIAARLFVITGLVPVVLIRKAQNSSNRHGRDKPGHAVRGAQ